MNLLSKMTRPYVSSPIAEGVAMSVKEAAVEL